MNVLIFSLFDPFLILGVCLLVLLKRLIAYYIWFSFVICGIHIFMFSFNPVKDDAWVQLFVIRGLVDSIILLGLGYYLNNKSNSQMRFRIRINRIKPKLYDL